MKIIEIVHVRLLTRLPKSLRERIRESIDSESTDEVFTIFQRDNLESDLGVSAHFNIVVGALTCINKLSVFLTNNQKNVTREKTESVLDTALGLLSIA